MVRGDLSVFPFLSVMQMLLTSGRPGRLTVEHARGGQLWIDKGEIIHAQAGGLKGEAALQLLASLDGGQFTFDPDQTPPETTLNLKRETALRRLLDDNEAWVSLLRTFPDWSRSLRFTGKWSDAQPVTRAQYHALSLVSQNLSIRAMLERSAELPRVTLNTLRPFLMAGLIELVE